MMDELVRQVLPYVVWFLIGLVSGMGWRYYTGPFGAIRRAKKKAAKNRGKT